MNSLEMKRWTYADTKHLLQLDPSRWPSLRNVVSQLRAVSTWHIIMFKRWKSGCQRVGIRRPETTLKYVSNIWDRAFCRPSMEWRQTIFRIRWSDDPKTHQKEWIDTKRVKNLFNNMWGFKTFTHCLQTMIIVMTGLLWLGNGYSASLLKPSQFNVWLFSHHSLWQDVSNTHHCGKM